MKKSFLNLVAVCGFSLMAVNVYADQRTMGMDMAGMKMDGMKMDKICLLYTSPSPRDKRQSRMPSSA